MHDFVFWSFQQQQQAGLSGDFQECGPEDQASTKRKFSMDTALEEKICDLYDLFVDVKKFELQMTYYENPFWL